MRRMEITPTPTFTFDKVERLTVNGRHATPGTEVSVRGLGRCKFVALVTNPRNGQTWVDVMHHRQWRSVSVERVTRVHHVAKIGPAS